MSFYNISDVKRRVVEALAELDFASALDRVRAAADTIINNQRSVSRVLASKDLDALCEEIATSWYDNRGIRVSPGHSSGTVILATELAKAGGHVELIKDYVRCGEFPQPITLVLTDCFDRIDDVLSDGFSQAFDIKVKRIAATDSGQRLLELTKLLSELNPEKMLLVTHNQDSIAIVAALLQRAPETFFIHHADHHLCLGVTIEDFLHVDVAQYAYCNCRHTLRSRKNRYWPIVLQGEFSVRSPIFEQRKGLTTCAVGRPEKFEAREYAYDYFEIIPEILSTTGGWHIHIGPLEDKQLELINTRLAEFGIETSRFLHVPWVASVAEALIEYSVDMYLVSFPYGGAKSAIEAMAAGIPILVHKNYRSILTSSYFVVYESAYAWENTSDLLAILKGITPAALTQHSALSRAFYEENYTLAVLNSAIRKREGWEEDNPEFRTYYTDGLQAFLDEEHFLDKKTDSLDLKAELNRMNEEYAKIHTEYLRILEAYNRLLA